MTPLLCLPAAALLAFVAVANADAPVPVEVTFFTGRNFTGKAFSLKSTESCTPFPDELRTKVSSFYLEKDDVDVRLWKGEMCTGDSKVWSPGGSKLITKVGKTMSVGSTSFSTCSSKRMNLCRDMRAYINGVSLSVEMYTLSMFSPFDIGKTISRTVLLGAARVAALAIESSMCELCLGRSSKDSSKELGKRSVDGCSAPKLEDATRPLASPAGLNAKKTVEVNVFVNRTLTVISLLVKTARDHPVGKSELRSLYLVVVGREPRSPREEKVLDGWVRLSDDLDKNKNGFIEADEVDGIELDLDADVHGPHPASPADDDFADLD